MIAKKRTLTVYETNALAAVCNGADVFDYGIGRALRAIQRDRPELITITKPMGYYGDGTGQEPYFGAIATEQGRRAVSRKGEKGRRNRGRL